MSKELTPSEAKCAVGRIRMFYDLEIDEYSYLKGHDLPQDLDIIETALEEDIELRKENFEMDCRIGELENELQENEKYLKALEIIKKKNVNVGMFIKYCMNTDYQFYLDHHKAIMNGMSNEELTQEEFILLKEVLK